MTILITLLLIVFVPWMVIRWLGRSEDLSVYDHPVDPAARESFSNPAGPSSAHQEAVTRIKALGATASGLAGRARLQYSRDFMEGIPQGREFKCEFIPVDVESVTGEWVLAPGANASRRVLYLHGGAFIAGRANSHRTITSRISETTGTAVFAIDYRLMPEHRRMDGIEDCRTAYRWMLANGPNGPASPSRVYVSGDSAGGNLALSLANWIRDSGLRAPDAIVALSPVLDSTHSAPSLRRNLATDTMLGPLLGALLRIPRPLLTLLFVAQNRLRPANPVVSPIFAHLSNLPPVLIQVSEAEMLLDDAVRYVNKARASGSPAQLQSWASMLHVWQIFNPEVPEAMQAFTEIGSYLQSIESRVATPPSRA
jgi:acetyl esterase/lipase